MLIELSYFGVLEKISFETSLQKLRWRLSPFFIWRGSRIGNMIGNHENIPREYSLMQSDGNSFKIDTFREDITSELMMST